MTKNPRGTDEFSPAHGLYTVDRQNRAGQGQPQKENIAGKAVLIAGANRGIGGALVNETLRRGAKRVYAGTRGTLTIAGERVTPLTLDVTNAAQIQLAVAEVETLDVLINNAGIALYDDMGNSGAIEQSLAVNPFGQFNVTRTFLPQLRRSRWPSSTTCP
jgi:NAD(P)-dependent dehydrogenase (short-subunit alcohol dehydrogenase family)